MATLRGTPQGYRVWACCSCGARLDRLVTPDDAEADLLRSALLTIARDYRFGSHPRSPSR